MPQKQMRREIMGWFIVVRKSLGNEGGILFQAEDGDRGS